MKNKLFIVLLLNVFLVANTPIDADFTNARLMNGNGEGSNIRTKVSVVVDVNSTNVVQFNKVDSTITSIDETNHPLLIKKFSYNGRNPIRVKIASSKLFVVFNLHDTNETSPNGTLTIEDNIIRDGTTGGATNSGLNSISLIDKATPILLLAETVDSDDNGYIDNLKLKFTEAVTTNTYTNNGFSVSGYTVLGIRSSEGVGGDRNDSPSSENVYLRLKEKSSFDTDAKPSVSYSERLSNKLRDSSENNITTISSFSVEDKAKPRLVSAYAKSVHNGSDIFNLGFSEPIFRPLDVSENNKDIISGGGPSLNGALVKYSNGDRNISLELNESKYQGYIPDGHSPLLITVNPSAKDKNGNSFELSKIESIPVVLETIKPKLLSITRSGDKGHFIANFDEPIIILVEGDIKVEYNKNITGDKPYIIGAVQSKNKKTATLKVANMPVFTNTETRILTFVMTPNIKDLAGNSIEANESNKSFTITKDDTPPDARNFTVNLNDKKITIDFNDTTIAIDSFNPEAILISRFNEGNMHLTSNSKAVYDNDFGGNEGEVIITLSDDDVNSLKSFLKNKEDFNISISSNSGIVDFAANACSTKNIPLSSLPNSFISDNVSPKLISWDFDLDNKKMLLNFDEPMRVNGYNASDINISDSNITFLKKLTFSENNSSATASGKSIEIILFNSQIIDIINADLAKDIKHTFIEVKDNSTIKDIKGNSLKPLSNSSALRAKIYKADKNNVSKLVLVPNAWNHISINKPTKTIDIIASGKINHIYAYHDEIWNATAETIDPKVGYWIKAGDHDSNTLKIPSNSKTYIKGTKEADLVRIRSKINGVFHLIGIENNMTYEEIHNSKNSICQTMRIHHYNSDANSSSYGWDKNSSVLENSSLWVQCVLKPKLN